MRVAVQLQDIPNPSLSFRCDPHTSRARGVEKPVKLPNNDGDRPDLPLGVEPLYASPAGKLDKVEQMRVRAAHITFTDFALPSWRYSRILKSPEGRGQNPLIRGGLCENCQRSGWDRMKLEAIAFGTVAMWD
jgi:hypothetical protein